MIHPLRRLAKPSAPATPSPVPSDWLPLPELPSGSEKFVGLVAVFEAGSNYCALKFSGAYNVDWGDGTVENINADTVAQHEYDYANLSADSWTVCGYRQALVQVTPQAGQHLTAMDLGHRHADASSEFPALWLDISLNAPNCTSLKIGHVSGNSYLRPYWLERVSIGQIGEITDLSFLFASCKKLHSITPFDTSACQNFTALFYACDLLINPPLLDTSIGTDITYMFAGSACIKNIPAYNFSSVTTCAMAMYLTYGLIKCSFIGLRYSIDFSNSVLSAAAIDEIFTNLGTAAGAQTITVTGNPGAATCTPAIAQAKGWTVVTA